MSNETSVKASEAETKAAFVEEEKKNARRRAADAARKRKFGPGKTTREARAWLASEEGKAATEEALTKDPGWIALEADPWSIPKFVAKYEKRRPDLKKKIEAEKKAALAKRAEEEAMTALRAAATDEALDAAIRRAQNRSEGRIERWLANGKVTVMETVTTGTSFGGRDCETTRMRVPVSAAPKRVLYGVGGPTGGRLDASATPFGERDRFLEEAVEEANRAFSKTDAFREPTVAGTAKRYVEDATVERLAKGRAWESVLDRFGRGRVKRLLAKNPRAKGAADALAMMDVEAATIRDGMLDRVPEKYADLWPLAREKKRKFTIWAGPTNSGKTWAAVEKLAAADTGVYLGPLRLLAFEQFENLNARGVWCSLLTGEEKIEVPDGTHEARTIEVADFVKEYDVAVIDEAQMLGDPYRGGSWTAAILGIRADEVEVCCAPHAVELVKTLVESCGDTWEVRTRERMTELKVEEKEFVFPDDVLPGDALIAFSKRSVHAIASELQSRGTTCSVVYGSLPYDVRRREAKRFDAKETDVVVATDAIGMGVNLPIRRVVFMETKKFDGREVRPLRGEEIRQIAGRAGRAGRYPEGYATSVGELESVREALSTRDEDLVEAIAPFPKSLVEIDAKLSDTLKAWAATPPQKGFAKSDMTVKIALCEWCEGVTDDKSLIYDMTSIPFEERNASVCEIWKDMVKTEAAGKRYDVDAAIPVVDPNANLESLELAHKICDLLWAYCDRAGLTEESERVMAAKRAVSLAITAELEKQKLEGKKCKRCGKPLPYGYTFGVCEECHRTEILERRHASAAARTANGGGASKGRGGRRRKSA